MISQTAEYALRAVVYLASEPDVPKTTRQIAEITRVPMGYLSKVLQSLGRAGLISSQRGLNGGSVLLRPQTEITVYDVVSAVAPVERIRTCPLGLKSHGTVLCPLHKKLDDAMAMIEASFRSTTIADVLSNPTGSTPLCEFAPPLLRTSSETL